MRILVPKKANRARDYMEKQVLGLEGWSNCKAIVGSNSISESINLPLGRPFMAVGWAGGGGRYGTGVLGGIGAFGIIYGKANDVLSPNMLIAKSRSSVNYGGAALYLGLATDYSYMIRDGICLGGGGGAIEGGGNGANAGGSTDRASSSVEFLFNHHYETAGIFYNYAENPSSADYYLASGFSGFNSSSYNGGTMAEHGTPHGYGTGGDGWMDGGGDQQYAGGGGSSCRFRKAYGSVGISETYTPVPQGILSHIESTNYTADISFVDKMPGAWHPLWKPAYCGLPEGTTIGTGSRYATAYLFY